MDVATKLKIHELLARSAYALDEREVDMLEATFAPDAEMTLRIKGVPEPINFSGRETIMGLMRDSMAEQKDQRRHIVSNLFFPAKSDASARSCDIVSNITITSVDDGQIRLVTSGLYRDTVKLGAQGWQIATRIIELDMPY